MFTVCPKCTLTLAVTANDLRLGQGYVRCGRCANVFNALLKLSETPAGGDAVIQVAQADPASASQINRALTSAAQEPETSAAARIAPPRPPPPRPAPAKAAPPAPVRPSGSAATAATPASTVLKSAAPPASSPSVAAAVDGVPRTASLLRAPTAPNNASRPPNPAPPARAPAAPTPQPARPAPANSSAPVTRAAPAPLPAPAPRAAIAPRSAPATPPSPSSPAAPPSSAPPPASAAGARALTGAAAVRRTDAADAGAIDQFEQVLKTLGLSLDEEEVVLLKPEVPANLVSARAPGIEEHADTRTYESIVLEGDVITKTEGVLPDSPIDELDLFTQQLGLATSAVAGAPASRGAAPEVSTGSAAAPPSPSPVRPAAPPRGSRRARLAARLGSQGAASPAVPPRAASPTPTETADADEGTEANDVGEFASPALQPAAELTAGGGEPDLDIPGLRASNPRAHWIWVGGAAVLVILLATQALEQWRTQLANAPLIGAPLGHLYAALGMPIQPHWDLSAYEVRQQGAQSAAGTPAIIRVRFSLANHAARAQPVPVLRMTLLDRYGKRIAQRNLQPADYWPKDRPLATFLASDQRVDTEVEVRDPSADSASFELDVCLPDAQGTLHCAGDADVPGTL